MKHARKFATALAITAAATMALAGCGTNDNGGSGSSDNADETASLTFWHNGTGDKSQAFWTELVTAFNEQYPNVTINIQVVQNEEFDGKLQTAMAGNTTPDVFLQRGGGKLADMIDAQQVADITDSVNADVKSAMGVAMGLNTIDGKIYAMPMSFQPEGLWYNQDLFDKANITDTPTTLTEFNDTVSKLKAADIAPIALGAKDAWPAAHWFYSFALRECSQDTVANLTSDKTLDDPCWLKAFQDVQDLYNTQPFNDGFLTTVAQQGAGSASGLLANGQAAMELMGAWEPGVVGDLTPDKENLASLRFFSFPTIDGGQGDPTAMMAGSDGYSCSANAPEPACTDFLNFMGQKEWVEKYATAYSTLPARSDCSEVVTDPALQGALQAYSQAKYVSLWFDTLLGQDVGNAVNAEVVKILNGGSAADALAGMQAAVKAG